MYMQFKQHVISIKAKIDTGLVSCILHKANQQVEPRTNRQATSEPTELITDRTARPH